MSDLSKLLRSSRLAQVARPNTCKKIAAGKIYPTHQIIQTTPSSLFRNNFGLKADFPSKVNSRYIVLDKLDTIEHMTGFEKDSSFYWKKQRFQELNIPVNVPANKSEHGHPLFAGNTETRNDTVVNRNKLPLASLLNLDSTTPKPKVEEVLNKVEKLRKPFFNWLYEKHPMVLHEMLSPNESKKRRSNIEHAVTFLKEYESKNSTVVGVKKQLSELAKLADGRAKIAGTGGLSYNLKNRLANSPNGISTKNHAPARLLSNSENNMFAVGGFVGTSFNYYRRLNAPTDKHARQEKLKIEVTNAILSDDGLSIDVGKSRDRTTSSVNGESLLNLLRDIHKS